MTRGPGDSAGDLAVLAPDGARVPLSAFAAEATTLIFLRHLG